MQNSTKYNHYVPKFYLKKFLNENNILYQYDLKNKKYHAKTEKYLRRVGGVKNLYTLQDEDKISDKDFEIVKKLLKTENLDDIWILNTLRYFLNGEVSKIFTVHHEGIPYNVGLNVFTEFFKDDLDTDISRNQEDLFSLYEKDFIEIYRDIIKSQSLNNLSNSENNIIAFKYYIFEKIVQCVYNTIPSKLMKSSIDNTRFKQHSPKLLQEYTRIPYYDFIHYILVQYFRTEKQILAQVEHMSNVKKNINFSKGVICLINHYLAIRVLFPCIDQGYQIVLLYNKSAIDFITADQPCINTYYFKDPRNMEDHEFEIYYPLSNKLAILYSVRNYQSNTITIENDKEIDSYNYSLLENTNRYLYGSKISIERIALKSPHPRVSP